jgi:hypothetical protein
MVRLKQLGWHDTFVGGGAIVNGEFTSTPLATRPGINRRTLIQLINVLYNLPSEPIPENLQGYHQDQLSTPTSAICWTSSESDPDLVNQRRPKLLCKDLIFSSKDVGQHLCPNVYSRSFSSNRR